MDESIDMNAIVAANIEREMKAHGLNMASLSRKAGLSETVVYDILRQRTRSPRVETITKIARALDAEAADLLKISLGKEAEDDLISTFASLGPEKRDLLLKTARSWLD